MKVKQKCTIIYVYCKLSIKKYTRIQKNNIKEMLITSATNTALVDHVSFSVIYLVFFSNPKHKI